MFPAKGTTMTILTDLTGTCLLCPDEHPMSGEQLLKHLATAHGMPTTPAHLNRQEAVAYNVLSRMLPQGSWMPLADRAEIARAVVEALHLDEHLGASGGALAGLPVLNT